MNIKVAAFTESEKWSNTSEKVHRRVRYPNYFLDHVTKLMFIACNPIIKDTWNQDFLCFMAVSCPKVVSIISGVYVGLICDVARNCLSWAAILFNLLSTNRFFLLIWNGSLYISRGHSYNFQMVLCLSLKMNFHFSVYYSYLSPA